MGKTHLCMARAEMAAREFTTSFFVLDFKSLRMRSGETAVYRRKQDILRVVSKKAK